MSRINKHLFIDDYDIEELSGLHRIMHQPKKVGAVLKHPRNTTQIRSAPMWDAESEIYKMLYLADGVYYAVSNDGLNWEMPDLGRPNLSNTYPRNQVITETEDGRLRGGPGSVVLDTEDPDPNRRYKGIGGISANGYDFKYIDSPPVRASDETQVVYDQERRRFLYLVKIGNEWGRAVSLSISTDFQNWTSPQHIFGADKEDQIRAREIIRNRSNNSTNRGPYFFDPEPPSDYIPEKWNSLSHWAVDIYNMPVFPYEGMYIGMPVFFYRTGLEPPWDNTDGFKEIQLTSSRDLVHWQRLGNREPFIETSEAKDALLGVYDRNSILAASRPVEIGDELWFYYTGIKFRASPYHYLVDGTPRPVDDLSPLERADMEEGMGAVCLAILRKDGFISLDGDAYGGFVLSKIMIQMGTNLYLNFAASNGRVMVEVLDAERRPVSGFSKDDCLVIKGDFVRLAVKWKNSDLKDIQGQRIQLRISLENASLYSYWIE